MVLHNTKESIPLFFDI